MKTIRHIAALDGLRGLAALIVVLFHLFETFSTGPTTQVLNHGYLAVEFFFLLSGYILCHAYDERKIDFWTFILRRIKRLHPMILLGTTLGLLMLGLQKCNMFPLLENLPIWRILIVYILSCLLIPTLPSLDIRGWTEMYPLNSPQWTMLFEYIANILYAVFLRKTKNLVIALLAIIAALLTVDLSLNLNLLSIYGDRGANSFTVIGGWTSTWPDIYIAFVRLLYPFLIGMLMRRMQIRIHCTKGPIFAAFLLGLVLCSPRLFPAIPFLNGIYEMVCVLFVLPLVLLLSDSDSIGGRCVYLCNLMGEFSFPLYLTHFPFVYLQIRMYERNPEYGLLISVGCFCLILTSTLLFGWVNRGISFRFTTRAKSLKRSSRIVNI